MGFPEENQRGGQMIKREYWLSGPSLRERLTTIQHLLQVLDSSGNRNRDHSYFFLIEWYREEWLHYHSGSTS